MTPLQQLSVFADTLRPAALPGKVVAAVSDHVLDTLGLCLAARGLDTSQMARHLAASWGGPAESRVIGFTDQLPAPAAAFVNGVLAHSLDYDDTHLPSILHPSATIVPAVLAVGEQKNSCGADMVAALAVGYEICVRTGMAAYDQTLGNSVFFERGWHATSICGTLGAAAACAKLYGLDAIGIGHALGIAVSMSAGVIEGNRSGGSVKRLHCGWAAHAGVIAAQSARAGFTGPPSAFEGRFGFYQAFCGGLADAGALTRGLGTEWCVPDLFFKPYPANHFTHAGIDCALALRGRVNVDAIETIELGVAAPTLRTIAEPRDVKIRPATGYQGQFSGPFTVAAAFLGGSGLGVGFDDFTDERVADPRYLALAAKVHCVADETCGKIFPHQFPAVMRVQMTNGATLEHQVLANRGGPGRPLSRHELRTKFFDNATRAVSREAAEALADAVSRMVELNARDVLGPRSEMQPASL